MKRSAQASGGSPSEPAEAKAVLVPLDEVEAEGVEWLWPERVPLGRVTVLAGEGGVGKSLVALDIAARASRGGPWPEARESQIPDSRLQIQEGQDEGGSGGGVVGQSGIWDVESGMAGHVVLLMPEDDLAGTVRPRLEAAGADLARVAEVRVAEASQVLPRRAFALEECLAAVRRAIGMRGKVRLVVVDPVEAFAQRETRRRKGGVGGVLAALGELAEETGAAVLAVVGRGVRMAARAAWAVVADAEVSERRLLVPMKNTLVAGAAGLAFRVEGWPERPAVARVAWEPLPASRVPARRGRVAEAAAWLLEALREGPVLKVEVVTRARGAGLSWASLRRAKRRLGVVPRSTGWQRAWQWRLPGGSGGGARGAMLSHIEPHWGTRRSGGENGPIRN